MSAVLIAERETGSTATVGSTERVGSAGLLAPVVPLRPSTPPPGRAVRPGPRGRSVARRAGSRGPRYVRAERTTSWQLTARGQLLVRRLTALATVTVAALVLTAGGFALARALAGPEVSMRSVSVQPGQSLWQVARAAAPASDVRDTVDAIKTLNHLTGSTVTPGQVLIVPVAG